MIILLILVLMIVSALAFVGRAIWPEIVDLIRDFHWFGF